VTEAKVSQEDDKDIVPLRGSLQPDTFGRKSTLAIAVHASYIVIVLVLVWTPLLFTKQ
jgi:hypothetical protein